VEQTRLQTLIEPSGPAAQAHAELGVGHRHSHVGQLHNFDHQSPSRLNMPAVRHRSCRRFQPFERQDLAPYVGLHD
jgi:hypothetical protein